MWKAHAWMRFADKLLLHRYQAEIWVRFADALLWRRHRWELYLWMTWTQELLPYWRQWRSRLQHAWGRLADELLGRAHRSSFQAWLRLAASNLAWNSLRAAIQDMMQ